MRASNIAAYEKDFRARGIDSDGKKFVLGPLRVKVPGLSEEFEVVTCKPRSGDESFFYKVEHPKRRIVVHHTAGYLKADIAALTTPNRHVSVPFVVARDGTIYNLWASRWWSYHLGPGAQGGNEPMSRSSVGIELSNLGWLRRRGDDLVTYQKGSPVYCSLDEKEFFKQLPQPYRGYSYFATFTEGQYVALGRLLRYLAATYDIPRELAAEAQRYEVLKTVSTFRGITTHVNYQPESYGKWDIGPAFDWERVLRELRASPGGRDGGDDGDGGRDDDEPLKAPVIDIVGARPVDARPIGADD